MVKEVSRYIPRFEDEGADSGIWVGD